MYDSVSNNFFEMDKKSRKLIRNAEGNTDELRVLGNEFWNEIYGDADLWATTERQITTETHENPEILILELTQQCNFRCEYCIYSGHYKYERVHKNINMSEDMAELIVEKYFKGSNTPQYVSFYGGEPLLQFELIKKIIASIEARHYYPKYTMTTNGSLLLNSEIAEYIVKERIKLNVSYDGLLHDRYRKFANHKSSSEIVLQSLYKLKELDSNYLKENVGLSITLADPYMLKENAEYFNNHELLRNIKMTVNLVNDSDNDWIMNKARKEQKQKLSDDYRELGEEFIEMDGLGVPFHKALFGNGIIRIENRLMELQTKAFPPGPCEPGKNRLFITALGEKYICERVGNYGKLGDLKDEKKRMEKYCDVISDFKNRVEWKCKNCILVRMCDGCYSLFREGNHLASDERINRICEEKRKWFDFMIYLYLSKKENGTI